MFGFKRNTKQAIQADVAHPEAHLPQHIAIVMDGNGRWALQRRLPRVAGHHQGAEAARRIVKAVGELGISYLTLYAFSSENWHRSPDEVSELIQLLQRFLKEEVAELSNNNVRLRVVGNRTRFAADVLALIERAEALTANNSGLQLTLALSYGAREELTLATRRIAEAVQQGHLKPEDVGEDVFQTYLYTSGVPDPDLLIRTSGEMRVSNFLLWQIAYTELFFTPVLWPDFGEPDLQEALKSYQQRQRRYGRA